MFNAYERKKKGKRSNSVALCAVFLVVMIRTRTPPPPVTTTYFHQDANEKENKIYRHIKTQKNESSIEFTALNNIFLQNDKLK